MPPHDHLLRGQAGTVAEKASKDVSRPAGWPRSSAEKNGANSVAFARLSREKLVKLIRFAFVIVGVIGGLIILAGDVGPVCREFGVEFEPFFQPRFGVWQDRFGRTFWLTNAAIDALAGVDDEHVIAFIEAIHRAYFDAVHIFAFDAGLSDNIGHCWNPLV